ncbi:glycoside hydrolase family 16 protein [Biscogniauxia mediterranea]|nr:glycoside hydrolase family 16 protein [Biscogniauxia mediterranea]
MTPPPAESGYSLSNWNIVNAGPNAGNAKVQHYTQSNSNSSLSGSAILQITPQNVSWHQCGEWDIFENAHGADFSLATFHYGRGGTDHLSLGGGALKVNRTPSNWQDETLEWWLDGTKFFQIKGSGVGGELLSYSNVAVGSNFPGGGQPDDNTTTGLETGLQVKYVAIYQTN